MTLRQAVVFLRATNGQSVGHREHPTRELQIFLPDYVLLSKNKNQHVRHRVQRLSGNFQRLECGQHLALKLLVMGIERMKILGWTTTLRPTYSGQYWFDHLLAQD